MRWLTFDVNTTQRERDARGIANKKSKPHTMMWELYYQRNESTKRSCWRRSSLNTFENFHRFRSKILCCKPHGALFIVCWLLSSFWPRVSDYYPLVTNPNAYVIFCLEKSQYYQHSFWEGGVGSHCRCWFLDCLLSANISQ